MALGVNMVAAVAGSFLGLLIGGVLSQWDWRAIFWVGVPIGILGTIWSVRSLHETRRAHAAAQLDWAGNVTFGVGLTVLLTGITYGIQPYGGHTDRLEQSVGARCDRVSALLAARRVLLHRAARRRSRWSTCGCSARRRSGWATWPG